MPPTYTVTGTLTDGRTVTLDEALPITGGKVKVVVEVLPTDAKRPFLEGMQEVWDALEKSGYKPRTREEVDAYLRAERENWD